jgi:hypothetical protein
LCQAYSSVPHTWIAEAAAAGLVVGTTQLHDQDSSIGGSAATGGRAGCASQCTSGRGRLADVSAAHRRGHSSSCPDVVQALGSQQVKRRAGHRGEGARPERGRWGGGGRRRGERERVEWSRAGLLTLATIVATPAVAARVRCRRGRTRVPAAMVPSVPSASAESRVHSGSAKAMGMRCGTQQRSHTSRSCGGGSEHKTRSTSTSWQHHGNIMVTPWQPLSISLPCSGTTDITPQSLYTRLACK